MFDFSRFLRVFLCLSCVRVFGVGEPHSLRRAGIFGARGQLLHPALDDAKPAAGGGVSAHGEECFTTEGTSEGVARSVWHFFLRAHTWLLYTVLY